MLPAICNALLTHFVPRDLKQPHPVQKRDFLGEIERRDILHSIHVPDNDGGHFSAIELLEGADDALVEGLDERGDIGREEGQLNVGQLHIMRMGTAIVKQEKDFVPLSAQL